MRTSLWQVHRLTGKLRTVIAEQDLSDTAFDSYLVQGSDHIISLQFLPDLDRQAFSRGNIHHRECPEAPAIRQLIGNEIETPRLVAIGRTKPIPPMQGCAPPLPRLVPQRPTLPELTLNLY